MKTDFSRFLRRRRQELDKTQMEIAQACGLTVMSITMIEAGQRRLSLERVPRLAEVLQVRPALPLPRTDRGPDRRGGRMKKQSRKHPEGFDCRALPATLPHRDYRRMSARQLLREGKRFYTGLQVAWRVELEMPNPDWQILESISRQLRLFEERCPEVCEL